MPKNDSNWGMMIGIGSQVLAGVGLGLVVGMWLDKKYGWTPWGVLVCTLVGLAAGMYSMIREGIRINRDPPGPKRPGSDQ